MQKKNVNKCQKTKKSKLVLSRKYLNCHGNKNSLTYHRQNTKNIFHSFSKQNDEKIRLFDFLAKNIMPYAAKQLQITFHISLTLFKAFF